jgi:hypothetical protein
METVRIYIQDGWIDEDGDSSFSEDWTMELFDESEFPANGVYDLVVTKIDSDSGQYDEYGRCEIATYRLPENYELEWISELPEGYQSERHATRENAQKVKARIQKLREWVQALGDGSYRLQSTWGHTIDFVRDISKGGTFMVTTPIKSFDLNNNPEHLNEIEAFIRDYKL